ncbi:hypothetical protein Calab_3677 [Caldithrix abyssi DSM 13497]|uniref:Nickel transport protein n=1 Tax=Caldithrix abyssi DSM 13497 TaxID=880073 RepID=H1XNN6_CALAY|nr:hypothetical protein [Caldithrix abyssi]APF19373.1 nickel transport protein [Caldithrix abyssi DSM 13497]EHO43274.1 hypothetical protein Calab_3677 [Caldithrix abyssi DSM 13497]
MRINLILLFALTCCWQSVGFAHGVTYHVVRDSAVIVKLEYKSGEPISYAKIKIFAPDNDEVEYQNGRTDRNGCFAFVPDQEGVWAIKVDDGTGHGINKKITINRGATIESHSHHESDRNNYIGAFGVLMAVTGLLFYWKSRRN